MKRWEREYLDYNERPVATKEISVPAYYKKGKKGGRCWLALSLRIYGIKRKDIANYLDVSTARVDQLVATARFQLERDTRQRMKEWFGCDAMFTTDNVSSTGLEIVICAAGGLRTLNGEIRRMVLR